ncbi:MAG: monovalent cation/H+ antiporter complex subunit F [Chloroflexota bacterium]
MSWFQLILQIVILPLLSVAIILAFIRLFLGPSISDRVIALDLMAALSIGIISVYAILTEQAIFLDVALVTALLTFLATIAFAYYIEQRKL